jgi:3-dehydroquinate dehydratase II
MTGGTAVKVLVLNGPNLGRLGTREPEIYGHTTYDGLVALCKQTAADLGVEVDVRQTESEAELLGWLHEAADTGAPVLLNAAALTHTSIAIGDACAQLTGALVEVHISNVYKREPFRHHSYVSAHASGAIIGLGVAGYALALRWLAEAT